MKRLFSWMLMAGLFLGPSVAYGAFNLRQGPEFDAWFENSLDSVRTLYFNRNNQIQRLNSVTRAVVGEISAKEYVLHIADLGTAASHYLVVPTTGTIFRIDVTTNGLITGANTVLRMFSSGIDGRLNVEDANYLDDRVTSFTVTLTTTQERGIRTFDDSIYEAVNAGDVIAIETNGGSTATVIGNIVIHIRME